MGGVVRVSRRDMELRNARKFTLAVAANEHGLVVPQIGIRHLADDDGTGTKGPVRVEFGEQNHQRHVGQVFLVSRHPVTVFPRAKSQVRVDLVAILFHVTRSFRSSW